MKIKLLLTFLAFSSFVVGQEVPEDVKPPSWKENLEIVDQEKVKYKLPTVDVIALMKEDLVNDNIKSKPWRFGKELYVDHDMNDYGEWTVLDNGDKIWRMSYTSDGATSLNFVFDRFYLPVGSKLYVYNDDKSDLLRPFTHHNNNEEEVLGTWLVQGNTVWLEYYQPVEINGTPKLTLGSVVHGYRTAESFQKGLNDSGSCNQDVDCDITPPFDPFNINTRKEEVKRAAGMMVVGANGFCSGTLINNTNNDATPYFLTANHCGSGEGIWAFRFNWRSPNPSCSTFTNSTQGTFDQTVSGASFRAASSRSDMKLVEINDNSFFANNSEVVWAGWNRSTSQVPQLEFGVHHPSGDIQKTCRNDQSASRISTPFNGDPNTQVWLVENWELGVTEQGSSGSGLFDQNGRIIGILSGGNAACSGTNDNGGFDIYGRFGVAWDFGTIPSSRLRDWLDPTNSGVTTLDVLPNPLSVEEQTLENSITIFPNPTKDVINIKTTGSLGETDYQIINALGQKVQSGTLNIDSTLHKINTDNLGSGLYFIQLNSGTSSMIQKVIKE